MKLVLVAVITAAIAAGAFLFLMKSRAESEVATFRERGVCINTPSPEYSIEASRPADFWLVDITASGGRGMRVYIGNFPQLEPSAIESARVAHGTMVPVVGKENQFVAVEPGDGAPIVHVMLRGVRDRESLLEGIRFCGDRQ